MTILILCGCSDVEEGKIPGTYVSEYNGGADTLEVHLNGTYVHRFTVGRDHLLDENTWRVENWKGELLAISFENFRFRTYDGRVKAPGVWHVNVETEWLSGKYKLCFDPDLHKCFVKK